MVVETHERCIWLPQPVTSLSGEITFKKGFPQVVADSTTRRAGEHHASTFNCAALDGKEGILVAGDSTGKVTLFHFVRSRRALFTCFDAVAEIVRVGGGDAPLADRSVQAVALDGGGPGGPRIAACISNYAVLYNFDTVQGRPRVLRRHHHSITHGEFVPQAADVHAGDVSQFLLTASGDAVVLWRCAAAGAAEVVAELPVPAGAAFGAACTLALPWRSDSVFAQAFVATAVGDRIVIFDTGADLAVDAVLQLAGRKGRDRNGTCNYGNDSSEEVAGASDIPSSLGRVYLLMPHRGGNGRGEAGFMAAAGPVDGAPSARPHTFVLGLARSEGNNLNDDEFNGEIGGFRRHARSRHDPHKWGIYTVRLRNKIRCACAAGSDKLVLLTERGDIEVIQWSDAMKNLNVVNVIDRSRWPAPAGFLIASIEGRAHVFCGVSGLVLFTDSSLLRFVSVPLPGRRRKRRSCRRRLPRHCERWNDGAEAETQSRAVEAKTIDQPSLPVEPGAAGTPPSVPIFSPSVAVVPLSTPFVPSPPAIAIPAALLDLYTCGSSDDGWHGSETVNLRGLRRDVLGEPPFGFPVTYTEEIWSMVLELPGNAAAFKAVAARSERGEQAAAIPWAGQTASPSLLSTAKGLRIRRLVNNLKAWSPALGRWAYLQPFAEAVASLASSASSHHAFELAAAILLWWGHLGCRTFAGLPAPPIGAVCCANNVTADQARILPPVESGDWFWVAESAAADDPVISAETGRSEATGPADLVKCLAYALLLQDPTLVHHMCALWFDLAPGSDAGFLAVGNNVIWPLLFSLMQLALPCNDAFKLCGHFFASPMRPLLPGAAVVAFLVLNAENVKACRSFSQFTHWLRAGTEGGGRLGPGSGAGAGAHRLRPLLQRMYTIDASFTSQLFPSLGRLTPRRTSERLHTLLTLEYIGWPPLTARTGLAYDQEIIPVLRHGDGAEWVAPPGLPLLPVVQSGAAPPAAWPGAQDPRVADAARRSVADAALRRRILEEEAHATILPSSTTSSRAKISRERLRPLHLDARSFPERDEAFQWEQGPAAALLRSDGQQTTLLAFKPSARLPQGPDDGRLSGQRDGGGGPPPSTSPEVSADPAPPASLPSMRPSSRGATANLTAAQSASAPASLANIAPAPAPEQALEPSQETTGVGRRALRGAETSPLWQQLALSLRHGRKMFRKRLNRLATPQ